MDHLCYLCLVFVMLSRLFISALWSPAGKGLTSWLLFVMSNRDFVTFPCGILGQVWYLIVLIPELCRFLILRPLFRLFLSGCLRQVYLCFALWLCLFLMRFFPAYFLPANLRRRFPCHNILQNHCTLHRDRHGIHR